MDQHATSAETFFMRLAHSAEAVTRFLEQALGTLPKDNEQILASRYQLHLPSVEELRSELTRERQAAQQALEAARD